MDADVKKECFQPGPGGKDRQLRAVMMPWMQPVPRGDLAWVVTLRWKLGQPFSVGDTNHLSHRPVRRGCSRSAAVVSIWLLAAASGALALMVLQR